MPTYSQLKPHLDEDGKQELEAIQQYVYLSWKEVAKNGMFIFISVPSKLIFFSQLIRKCLIVCFPHLWTRAPIDATLLVPEYETAIGSLYFAKFYGQTQRDRDRIYLAFNTRSACLWYEEACRKDWDLAHLLCVIPTEHEYIRAVFALSVVRHLQDWGTLDYSSKFPPRNLWTRILIPWQILSSRPFLRMS